MDDDFLQDFNVQCLMFLKKNWLCQQQYAFTESKPLKPLEQMCGDSEEEEEEEELHSNWFEAW